MPFIIYIRCCQARDASNPELFWNDEITREINYHANFLAHLMASLQMGYQERIIDNKGLSELGLQLLENTLAHTPYRKNRVEKAHEDLKYLAGFQERRWESS